MSDYWVPSDPSYDDEVDACPECGDPVAGRGDLCRDCHERASQAATETAAAILARAQAAQGTHPLKPIWETLTRECFAEQIVIKKAARTGLNPIPALDLLDQAAALLPDGLGKQVTDRTAQTRAIAATRGF